MTPWVVKMTLLKKKKSKWLSWRGRPGVKKTTPLKSQNDSFELTVYTFAIH